MNAVEFNKKHKVGASFIHHAHPALCGGHVVKTVDIARDFNCGAIVEINQEPYFVRIDGLRPAWNVKAYAVNSALNETDY